LYTQQLPFFERGIAGLIALVGFADPVLATSGLDRFTVENFNLEKDIS
jgi:hypothetical protein